MFEIGETVVLTLTPDSAYTIGGSNHAVVIVTDNVGAQVLTFTAGQKSTTSP